jgi:hypothetical protein
MAMGLVELEFGAGAFRRTLHAILTGSTTPVPTFDRLGDDRLITGLDWGGPDDLTVAATPPDAPLPDHLLGVRARIAVRHLSVAELDLDAAASPTTAPATAWLVVAITGSVLSVALSRLDIDGLEPQPFAVRLDLWSQSIALDESVPLVIGAVLHADGVVTLRLTTTGTDNLLAPPRNRVGVDHHFLLRVSGDAIADLLRRQLAEAIDPPPPGCRVESAPVALWGDWAPELWGNAQWAAVANCVIEKRDACPGLFGAVDLSVEAQALLSVRIVEVLADPERPPGLDNPAHPELELTVHLRGDASDWDSFRCWLGTGGVGALFFGSFVNPALGVVFGMGSLIALGDVVRGRVGEQVAGMDVARFTRIAGDDESATYRRLVRLPLLERLIGLQWSIDGDGLVIRGNLPFFTTRHVTDYVPPPGVLSGVWGGGHLDCATGEWVPDGRFTMPAVQVSDRVVAIDGVLWQPTVRIFPTSVALPGESWGMLRFSSGEVPPDPAVEGPPRPRALITTNGPAVVGTSGRAYVHTNVGLVRYDLAAVPPAPSPEPGRLVAEQIRCAKAGVRSLRELGPAGAHDLGLALVTLAGLIVDAGRPGEAVAVTQEAVDIFHRLAEQDPENKSYVYRRGWSLIVLAERLGRAGHPAEAEASVRTADAVLAGLIPRLEAAGLDDLALDAAVQIATHADLLPPDAAVTALLDDVPVVERLAGRHPDDGQYGYRHGWIHLVLAERLDAARRRPEATAHIRTAYTTFSGLVPDLEGTLDNLVFDIVVQIGAHADYLPRPEAARALRDAVPVAERLVGRHPGDAIYAQRLGWLRDLLASYG